MFYYSAASILKHSIAESAVAAADAAALFFFASFTSASKSIFGARASAKPWDFMGKSNLLRAFYGLGALKHKCLSIFCNVWLKSYIVYSLLGILTLNTGVCRNSEAEDAMLYGAVFDVTLERFAT